MLIKAIASIFYRLPFEELQLNFGLMTENGQNLESINYRGASCFRKRL